MKKMKIKRTILHGIVIILFSYALFGYFYSNYMSKNNDGRFEFVIQNQNIQLI